MRLMKDLREGRVFFYLIIKFDLMKFDNKRRWMEEMRVEWEREREVLSRLKKDQRDMRGVREKSDKKERGRIGRM